ncbi:MAG: glucose-6-phosphate 1-dehydrogenase [Clostridia bacterium]|nr:glucose-6-phosphate 1-dehydrogenase [Clostridia bacterium]
MAPFKPDPCLFLIFGATGDLARKKLFPAFYNLYIDNFLPASTRLVAVGRRPYNQDAFREQILLPSLKTFSRRADKLEQTFAGFAARCVYFQSDIYDPQGYARLKDLLRQLEEGRATGGNRVYYLAVAPVHFGRLVAGLREENILANSGWQRVIIEKPFGHDLESARRLNRLLDQVFAEEEIYRIDHYLGKEMIQNIMVIRFANAFFEPVWNNKYIDHVQISSVETVGVGERGGYYEKAGALRDMVQNHMLQLLAMIAMEPPSSLATGAIRDEKVKILRSLRSLNPEAVRRDAVRGQYGEGFIEGKPVVAYRQEKDVAADSATETFVALKIFIDNFRWAGVPFYIRTGKRLPVKSTEIILQFKALPEVLYFKEYGELQPNLLVIRVQPYEGVFVQLNAKRPGNNNYIVPIRLDFCQNCEAGVNSPEAYERLLYDAMRGDRTLFTGWEEVEQSWRFIDPIAKVWAAAAPLFPNYAAGQWGPEAAASLLLKDGRRWWNAPAAQQE